MKAYIILFLVSLLFSAQIDAQRKISNDTKYGLTHIATNFGTVESAYADNEIVFPNKGSKFESHGYILTKEGKKLKIGGDIRVTYPNESNVSSGQYTAQNGSISDVSQSVTLSNGGTKITISTTTSTKGGDGRISSSTKTTTINTKTGETSRSVSVSNGQGTPEQNGNVVVVVRD